jgi:hypothetical protein
MTSFFETTSTAVESLPNLDSPSISPQMPAASYKLAYSDSSCWYISRDNGISSEPTGSIAVAGSVLDLSLHIAPARMRSGDDYRLRLAFYESSGELVELNLNAVSRDADGVAYTTSPVRSLIGALLTISEAEDDMQAICRGARFSIRPGQGRGLFLETDVAVGQQWIRTSGPMATLRIAKDPERFCLQVTEIKARFRAYGLMFNGPAVQRAMPVA